MPTTKKTATKTKTKKKKPGLALMRTKVKESRAWHCPFVHSENPDSIFDAADELIQHMAAHHQDAFAAAVREQELLKQRQDEEINA